MSVSLVVTTFERPAHLARVLAALLDQTHGPDQVVVADDGSTDATRRVIEDFRACAPFPVDHAWQEHVGFRAARVRNLATRVATRDYIVYLDGDCLPTRHFVADHLRLARPGRCVHGKVIWVREGHDADFTARAGFWRLLALRWRGGLHRASFPKLVHVPGVSYPRAGRVGALGGNFGVWRHDLVAVNGWNEAFEGWGKEDDELALRLQRAGVRRHIALGSALVFHLPHPPSPRPTLDVNRRLLDAARSGEPWAELGLDQH